MKASNRIINKIKEFEGFSAKPYYDSAGVLTIGYGTTKDASKYKNISKETATQLLLRDLAEFETQLNNYINNRGYSLNQNQYDAMVSLAYNIGPSGFKNSEVAKKFNSGDVQGASEAFTQWTRAGNNKTLLAPRRNREIALFNQQDTNPKIANIERQKVAVSSLKTYSKKTASVDTQLPDIKLQVPEYKTKLGRIDRYRLSINKLKGN